MRNFILNNCKGSEEVKDKMTEFLGNNRGIAVMVCDWLDDFFVEFAYEFVGTDEEDDERYVFVSDEIEIAEIFDNCLEDWNNVLCDAADMDDYSYELYYKMVDWQAASIRNSVPLIVERYMRLKLGFNI